MKYELQIQNMCIGADILITALKTLRVVVQFLKGFIFVFLLNLYATTHTPAPAWIGRRIMFFLCVFWSTISIDQTFD